MPTSAAKNIVQDMNPSVEEKENPVITEYKELENKCDVVLEKIAKKRARKSIQ
jgi:hypothetical protein